MRTPAPRQASTCLNCDAACLRAKAAGHRDWREHACYDCAGVNLDECFASVGYVPDEADAARELAKMNALRHVPASQLDLFGASQ